MNHNFIIIINKIMKNNKYDTQCDCCLTENIYVVECSTNNNCDYSMCKNCIDNLQYKTKTNLCPACREEKIEILLEPEYEHEHEPVPTINTVQETHNFKNCFIDSIKILCSPIYIIVKCIFNCFYSYYIFTQILFSLYTITNVKLRIFLTVFFSKLLLFTFFILSRGIYILFFPLTPFWCNLHCMILTTLPALFLFFLLIIFIILIVKCIISCITPSAQNNLDSYL
jgi:hypothetical protein